jgi:ssDNA-binding Zn-finger/Zn-ribbon topoisomerase 1
MALRERQPKFAEAARSYTERGIGIPEKKVGTLGTPVCPKCGASMVLRTSWGARIGTSFWGCSRYPRCCSTITTS